MNNNKQAQEDPLMEVLEDLEGSRDLKASRIHLGKGKQGKVKEEQGGQKDVSHRYYF